MLFSGPYQVGSFELELHPAVERIVAERPATVVNVGSAEGYYAVGLAMRLAGARVVGFELDPALRAAAAAARRAQRRSPAGSSFAACARSPSWPGSLPPAAPP